MLKLISDSWRDFEQVTKELAERPKTVRVLEIGGGAKPMFTKDQVQNLGINFTILDVDESQFRKSLHKNSRFITHDLSHSPLDEKFDLICSKMLLEHLTDPDSFHNNVLQMMHEETIVCHFFATKYGLPSLLNLVLPENFTDQIIYKFQRRNVDTEGKFKAYYRKCYGPASSAHRYFQNMGYELKDYIGYIGHGYLGRYKFWGKLERSFSKIIYRLKSPYLTSNAIITMKKSTILSESL